MAVFLTYNFDFIYFFFWLYGALCDGAHYDIVVINNEDHAYDISYLCKSSKVDPTRAAYGDSWTEDTEIDSAFKQKKTKCQADS